MVCRVFRGVEGSSQTLYIPCCDLRVIARRCSTDLERDAGIFMNIYGRRLSLPHVQQAPLFSLPSFFLLFLSFLLGDKLFFLPYSILLLTFFLFVFSPYFCFCVCFLSFLLFFYYFSFFIFFYSPLFTVFPSFLFVRPLCSRFLCPWLGSFLFISSRVLSSQFTFPLSSFTSTFLHLLRRTRNSYFSDLCCVFLSYL